MQFEIVEHVERTLEPIHRAIRNAENEIDMVREYRTRLIADVVTGKVDVRHFTPPRGSADLKEAVDELESLDVAEAEVDEEPMDGEVEP